MLLIDHQSGLLQTVKDMPMPELRANAITLVKVTSLAKIPVITTASVLQGPNGPLTSEIHEAAKTGWSRPGAAQWAEAYSQIFPHYQLLIESHLKAQQVAKDNEALDSQHQ
ncbi:hypothetical protein GCM10027514_04810 [Azotobacter armeniacus]